MKRVALESPEEIVQGISLANHFRISEDPKRSYGHWISHSLSPYTPFLNAIKIAESVLG